MSNILYWDFQQAPPILDDLSGNSNTGAVSGATRELAPDNTHYVYTFSGSADGVYAEVSTSLTGMTSYSIEIWFNMTNTAGVYIASHGSSPLGFGQRGWFLRPLGVYVELRAYSTDGKYTTLSALAPTGVWTYMVGTISQASSSINLYKNGSYVTSASFKTFRPETDYRASVGKSPRFSSYFNGSIGLFKLYNDPLDDSTILSNYQTTSGMYVAPSELPGTVLPTIMALFRNSIGVV